MAKGEIACFEQYLLLPQYFQKLQMGQNASIGGKELKFQHWRDKWNILFCQHCYILDLKSILEEVLEFTVHITLLKERTLTVNLIRCVQLKHHLRKYVAFLARLLKKRELLSWPWCGRRRGHPVKVFCSAQLFCFYQSSICAVRGVLLLNLGVML